MKKIRLDEKKEGPFAHQPDFFGFIKMLLGKNQADSEITLISFPNYTLATYNCIKYQIVFTVLL